MNQAQGPGGAEAGAGHPGTVGLEEWLRQTHLEDVLSTRHHSRDFNGSRAEYIYRRVRLLSLVFAGLALLWIPIDWVALPEGAVGSILGMRLGFSALYLLLGLWTARPLSLSLARLRMFLFLLFSLVFYTGSRLVLGDGLADQGVLIGYSFFPFLLVVLLAVFPLSLYEGLALSGSVGAVFVGNELYSGTLFTLATFADLWLLALLAGIGMWAQVAQLHMLLRLYREATRDALTGLVNRRVLTKWADVEIRRAEDEGSHLSVLLFDLDRFKRINDTYGHLTGDVVLRAFARILGREVVGANLIGRYGGEEFLAILPGHDRRAAIEVAERIRRACHAATVPAPGGDPVAFTVSVGVSEWTRGEECDALLNRVDKGLYQAKAGGRDMVVYAEAQPDS